MNGYGIDSMVQSRADAYRANPDGLAKSYAQNQQLIDLLALQKLKSEKEAAARQLTLTAQQSPGTVAQQREQELLGLTRDELAKQVGAVGEQQEQAAQQRLQQAAGLSSLPAPNLEAMPRYAEGGIVGAIPNVFPSPADTARVVAWLAEKGIDATQYTAEQIAEVLRNIDTFPAQERMGAYGTTDRPSVGELTRAGLESLNDLGRFDGSSSSATADAIVRGGERALGGLSSLWESAKSGARDVASALEPALDVVAVPGQELGRTLAEYKLARDMENAQQREAGRYKLPETDPELARLLAEQQARIDGTPVSTTAETTAAPGAPRTGTRDLAGVGGLASLIQQPTPAPAAAPAAIAAPQAPVAVPAEASALQRALEDAYLTRLQSTPEDARATAIEQTQELFAPVMDERKASYDEMRRRLQEIDARESDPKARAREALREWMRGAATARGGLGETLMGGGARSRNYIDEQEAADKARIQEMFGLEKELNDTQLDALKNVFAASEGAMDRQSAGANTAIQAAASMVEGRLNREAEERFNVARNELLLRQAQADEAANAVAQGRLSMDEFRNTVGALDRAYQSALDPLQLQLENMPIGGDQTPIIRAMQTLQTQYAEAMSRLSGGNLPAMGGVPEEQVFDYTEFFPQ